LHFQIDFAEKPDQVIINEILNSGHVYKRIQLLGILLKRHNENFPITSDSTGKSTFFHFSDRNILKFSHCACFFTVKDHLEDLNKKAGTFRYWSAVRYSSSLLRQMIDSISPYVTQILVCGKHVTVGTIGQSYTLFDKPMTPVEIHKAIYTKVQPFGILSAVLQQELILYCGKLIASHPELFSGILVVRMGWVLRALECYREVTQQNPDPIHACSPHLIRKLVFTVLSESQILNLNYKCGTKKDNEAAIDDLTTEEDLSGGGFDHRQDNVICPKFEEKSSKLSVYDVRKINGCLMRVPDNFYVDIWHILAKTKGGIYIQDCHLPQQPTISKMTR